MLPYAPLETGATCHQTSRREKGTSMSAIPERDLRTSSPPSASRRREHPVWDPAIARLTIEGLECQHCALRIRNALLGAPQVLGAEVDLRTNQVDVLFDASQLRLDGLAALIASAADGHAGRYEVVDARMT